MQTAGAINPVTPILPVDSSDASNLSAWSSPNGPLALKREAYGSEAGITVRLLAALPANLGQNLDAAA